MSGDKKQNVYLHVFQDSKNHSDNPGSNIFNDNKTSGIFYYFVETRKRGGFIGWLGWTFGIERWKWIKKSYLKEVIE